MNANNNAIRWGARAYKKGSPVSENPFHIGTENFNDWLTGWFEEKRLTEKFASNEPDLGEKILSNEELIDLFITPLIPEPDLSKKLESMYQLPKEFTHD